MSNMDYFQPLDKHVRVPLWTEAHTEAAKYGIVIGIFCGCIFILTVAFAYDNIPKIPEGPQFLGFGAYKMCAESCEDCHKQYHDHYLKAWRKVK